MQCNAEKCRGGLAYQRAFSPRQGKAGQGSAAVRKWGVPVTQPTSRSIELGALSEHAAAAQFPSSNPHCWFRGVTWSSDASWSASMERQRPFWLFWPELLARTCTLRTYECKCGPISAYADRKPLRIAGGAGSKRKRTFCTPGATWRAPATRGPAMLQWCD